MTKKGQKNEFIHLLGTGLSNSVCKKRIKVTDTDKKWIKILSSNTDPSSALIPSLP